MAYQDFLREFSVAQGVPDVQSLLTKFADRYAFQIKSRERAHAVIETVNEAIGGNLAEMRVLDVGCAYGSFAVEYSKLGAHVVGIDISDKWLKLAEANAKDEGDCVFFKCDASARRARQMLAPHGPFDLVLINDVFEHIYDTAGLLENLKAVMKPGGRIYYKVPNGMAVRSAISEGHKRVYGVSLLAPDYWQMFVTAPFNIYYRRESYFTSLFDHYGFVKVRDFTPVTDPSLAQTRKHIRTDLRTFKKGLRAEAFKTPAQYKAVREAGRYYIEEVEQDLEEMEWEPLFRKYRATFWVGMLELPPAATPAGSGPH